MKEEEDVQSRREIIDRRKRARRVHSPRPKRKTEGREDDPEDGPGVPGVKTPANKPNRHKGGAVSNVIVGSL